MGRIRRAVEYAMAEVAEAANNADVATKDADDTVLLAKAALLQAMTDGVQLKGTFKLFKLPSFLAAFVGKEHFEVEYETVIKLNDSQAEEQ